MLKVGNKVRFTYLKDAKTSIINGILTKDHAANAENYKGCLLYTSPSPRD